MRIFFCPTVSMLIYTTELKKPIASNFDLADRTLW